MLLASLVTGNIGLSVCAAFTIGSLTCRWFYEWKKVQQVNKRKEDSRRKCKEKAQKKIGNKD